MIAIGDSERELLRVAEALDRASAPGPRVRVDYKWFNTGEDIWARITVDGVCVIMAIGSGHDSAAAGLLHGLRQGRKTSTSSSDGKTEFWLRVPPFSSVEELEMKLACSGPPAGVSCGGGNGRGT